MAEERYKRKLTAILSADVAGYSRLMGEDEAATVKTLTVYRKIMGDLIQQHRGRVIDSPGDNILAEFASIVDAVQCAAATQNEFETRNAGLPENRRMEFRIGVNLGDVIEEESRIYGDGVNIAARLEGLAEAGGICISGTAFDQVKNKVPVGYQYLGKQTVKNIADPVRAYKVLMGPEASGKVIGEKERRQIRLGWKVAAVAVLLLVLGGLVWNFYLRPDVEPASIEKMAYPLPEKPSIAVLPFVNMTGNAKQEYIADGITENIITALSKVPEVFVIARNSVFTYKGKPVKINRVSEELGVQYVLEGSIQQSDSRLRITAQLIDATEGHHLWAERFDRDLNDIFLLQDEVTLNILSALRIEFTHGEQARVQETTNSLEAWGCLVQGLSHFESFTKDDNARAQELFERAVQVDPKYSYAWAMLGWTHWIDAAFGYSESSSESFKKAVEIAKKTLQLDDKLPDVHALFGGIYLFQRQYDQAIAEGQRAIELGPNVACNKAILARTMLFAGRFEEAVKLVRSAMRLNPYYPSWYLETLGMAYGLTGEHEKAIASYNELLRLRREARANILTPLVGLAAYSIVLGRDDEARTYAGEILEVNPDFSIERFKKLYLFRDPSYLKPLLEALDKAGLPEHPPLPLPDKPSIAVLPFVNMSDDPEQEYFSDGMTDDLITDLSKISSLFVIARNSTFAYKGRPVKIGKVAEELGVRYVLEGSVRKVSERIRINAQLIDATTGGHLWAERYDGNLGDVFSLQDKITRKIVIALAIKLTQSEEDRVARKDTLNIPAYDDFLKGWAHYVRLTPGDFAKAVHYFEKAIEQDPNYGRAYAALAATYWESYYRFWHESLGVQWHETRLRAEEYIQTAMKKDPTPLAHSVNSKMLIARHDYDEAIAETERALALDPNDASSFIAMAYAFIYVGKPMEAVNYIARAMRIDPDYPVYYLFVLGLAHFGMEQLEKAASSFEEAFERNPENYVTLLPLAATYAHLNREKEAREIIKKLYEFMPTISLAMIRTCPLWQYKNYVDKDRLMSGLEKAGMAKTPYDLLG